MDENLIQFAVNSITDYLNAHPESADTVEGIHQWWIEWPGIAESISITSIALKQLEQTGQIERRRIGNQEIWRLPMRGE